MKIERGNFFIAEVNFFHGGRVIPVFDKYLNIVWLYRNKQLSLELRFPLN